MDGLKVKTLKSLYPNGTRVKLLEMEDPFAPPIGTLGIGSILVSWDNGQSLNVLYGIDKIMKL